jgi:uncharacterized protein YraI
MRWLNILKIWKTECSIYFLRYCTEQYKSVQVSYNTERTTASGNRSHSLY